MSTSGIRGQVRVWLALFGLTIGAKLVGPRPTATFDSG